MKNLLSILLLLPVLCFAQRTPHTDDPADSNGLRTCYMPTYFPNGLILQQYTGHCSSVYACNNAVQFDSVGGSLYVYYHGAWNSIGGGGGGSYFAGAWLNSSGSTFYFDTTKRLDTALNPSARNTKIPSSNAVWKLHKIDSAFARTALTDSCDTIRAYNKNTYIPYTGATSDFVSSHNIVGNVTSGNQLNASGLATIDSPHIVYTDVGNAGDLSGTTLIGDVWWDGSFTHIGRLPAVSGANLTNLNGSNVTSGSVPAAHITEADPVFAASPAKGITGPDTTHFRYAYNKVTSSGSYSGGTITYTRVDGTTWAVSGLFTTETDPIFGASAAKGITTGDTTNFRWAAKKVTVYGAYASGTFTYTRADSTKWTVSTGDTLGLSSRINTKANITDTTTYLATIATLKDSVVALKAILATCTKMIAYQNTNASITATTTETVLVSLFVPAGTVGANNVLWLNCMMYATGTAGTKTYKAYINTSNTTAGATTILNYVASATVLNQGMQRRITNKNSVSTNNVFSTTSNSAPYESTSSTSAINTLNSDFSVGQYIIITCKLTNSADLGGISDAQLLMN